MSKITTDKDTRNCGIGGNHFADENYAFPCVILSLRLRNVDH